MMPDFSSAADDKLNRHNQNDKQTTPCDPAVTGQKPGNERRGNAHQQHRERKAAHENPWMTNSSTCDSKDIVQTHGKIGNDNLENGRPKTGRGVNLNVRITVPEFPIHFPADPEQQTAACKRQAHNSQKTGCNQCQSNSQDSRKRCADQNGQTPLSPLKATNRHPDDNSVVSRERDINEGDLCQRKQAVNESIREQGCHSSKRGPCNILVFGLSSLRKAPLASGVLMVPRYSRPQMTAIWSPANRYRIWFEIEALACEAMAEQGVIPAESAKTIREKGDAAMAAFSDADLARIDEIEAETRHDVIAFLTWLAEKVGPDSRFVHLGMTSSDVLDTCLSVQLTQASDLLLEDLERVLAALKARAYEHKLTVTIGRSHAIHAEPTSFGLKLAGHYAEFARNKERLLQARKEIAVCAISGAVGTYAHIDPAVEEYVADKLGLVAESVSTQVIPRDRHAAFFCTLGVIASGIERLAVEVRHLQRSEVREAEEFFHKGQKGSSAMPHKRNPVLSENLTGLARLIRSHVTPALENVALWHERDISHSAVERNICPDATIGLDFALMRLAGMMEKLMVYPDQMIANMESLGGVVHSGEVLLVLARAGISREDAYRIVQRNAMETWTKLGHPDFRTFRENLEADPEVAGRVSAEVLDRAFDPAQHLSQVDRIFNRIFG